MNVKVLILPERAEVMDTPNGNPFASNPIAPLNPLEAATDSVMLAELA